MAWWLATEAQCAHSYSHMRKANIYYWRKAWNTFSCKVISNWFDMPTKGNTRKRVYSAFVNRVSEQGIASWMPRKNQANTSKIGSSIWKNVAEVFKWNMTSIHNILFFSPAILDDTKLKFKTFQEYISQWTLFNIYMCHTNNIKSFE